jgi:hypothetical protein
MSAGTQLPLIAVIGESAISHPERAVIAIGAGTGTLSEIGHALRTGRRVIGLRTWQATIGGRPSGILEAATAEGAVRLALEADR